MEDNANKFVLRTQESINKITKDISKYNDVINCELRVSTKEGSKAYVSLNLKYSTLHHAELKALFDLGFRVAEISYSNTMWLRLDFNDDYANS